MVVYICIPVFFGLFLCVRLHACLCVCSSHADAKCFPLSFFMLLFEINLKEPEVNCETNFPESFRVSSVSFFPRTRIISVDYIG